MLVQGVVRQSWRPPLAVLLSGLLLLVSLLSYAGSVEPALRHTKWVALGAIVTGIPPILVKVCGLCWFWLLAHAAYVVL